MKNLKFFIGFSILTILFAGCAFPVGDDYTMPLNKAPIFIIDYNLQVYVPIPTTGTRPVFQINNRADIEAEIRWTKQDGNNEVEITAEYIFETDKVCKAEISITPKGSYSFDSDMAFSYPFGRVSHQEDDLKTPTRLVKVTYYPVQEKPDIVVAF